MSSSVRVKFGLSPAWVESSSGPGWVSVSVGSRFRLGLGLVLSWSSLGLGIGVGSWLSLDWVQVGPGWVQVWSWLSLGKVGLNLQFKKIKKL